MARFAMRSLAAVVCLSLVAAVGCDRGDSSSSGGGGATTQAGKRPRVAYITNGIDPFWDTAIAGAKVGAREFGLELENHKPAQGVTDQNRIVESLIAKRARRSSRENDA